MTIVVDASVVAAALADRHADGPWAESVIGADDLAAPHIMPVEVAAVLRRAERTRRISSDAATLAHADLLVMPVALFRYEPIASRIWELRRTVTSYDGWYVALAESLNAPLATLDRRLVAAPGPRCEFVTP